MSQLQLDRSNGLPSHSEEKPSPYNGPLRQWASLPLPHRPRYSGLLTVPQISHVAPTQGSFAPAVPSLPEKPFPSFLCRTDLSLPRSLVKCHSFY